jgi:hypothetical protein
MNDDEAAEAANAVVENIMVLTNDHGWTEEDILRLVQDALNG